MTASWNRFFIAPSIVSVSSNPPYIASFLRPYRPAIDPQSTCTWRSGFFPLLFERGTSWMLPEGITLSALGTDGITRCSEAKVSVSQLTGRLRCVALKLATARRLPRLGLPSLVCLCWPGGKHRSSDGCSRGRTTMASRFSSVPFPIVAGKRNADGWDDDRNEPRKRNDEGWEDVRNDP